MFTDEVILERRADVLFEAAMRVEDPHEPVTAGEWIGFHRADAYAWCWNLYQFEPRGLVHPGSELRSIRLRLLRGGELPDGFGYAHRARELEANGLTPRSYRQAKKALGGRIHPAAC